MSNTLDELYWMLKEQVDSDPDYREKRRALSVAALALVEEMEKLCGEKYVHLMDAMGGLDDRARELHEQLLFREAVRLGMELGRIAVN